MAASYTPVSSYATVKVMSPTQVLDIQMVGFYTHPSNIYCEYGVPHLAFVTEGSGAADQPLLNSLATDIERAASGNGVVGGTFVQEVDPGTGLLTDFVQFDLAYTPPTPGANTFTTTVNVPVNSFFSAYPGIGGITISSAEFPDPATVVGNAYAALQALGGG